MKTMPTSELKLFHCGDDDRHIADEMYSSVDDTHLENMEWLIEILFFLNVTMSEIFK